LEVDATSLTVDRLLLQAHRAMTSTTAKRATRRTTKKTRTTMVKAHQEAVQTLKAADVAADVTVAAVLDAAVMTVVLTDEVLGPVRTMVRIITTVDHNITVIMAAAAAGVHGPVAVPSDSVAPATPSIP
jgi:hypothetical protein